MTSMLTLFAVGILAVLPAAGTPAPDTVVLCPADFQPALEKWVDYRESQGHRIEVLAPMQTAGQIRNELKSRYDAGGLKYVLLVGTTPARDGVSESLTVPTGYENATINKRWGSEPEIATDYVYANLDEDPAPEVAVGRIPATSAAELTLFIDKVIARERNTAQDLWRRRVCLVAGTGGFSPFADRVIESTASYLISQNIPAGHQIDLTMASWRSQFCPAPQTFSQQTVETLSCGSQFWIYMGHGLPHQLDYVHTPRGEYPILMQSDVAAIDACPGQPVALLLACYTGAIDATERSLSESLMLAGAGPVAAIAASRVSMPYGNTVLGMELMRTLFQDRPTTLGELILTAKERTVAEAQNDPQRQMVEGLATLFTPQASERVLERCEHLWMYNLLGDPLLRLDQPARVELTGPATCRPGEEISVAGSIPDEGELILEWVVPLADRVRSLPMRAELAEDAHAQATYTMQQAEANHTVIAQQTTAVARGPFTTTLTAPLAGEGKYTLRAFWRSDDRHGLGALPIELATPSVAREPEAVQVR